MDNYSYGQCYVPAKNMPGSDKYGDGKLHQECLYNGSSMNQAVYPNTYKQQKNYKTLLASTNNVYDGVPGYSYIHYGANTNLQEKKPVMSTTNRFIVQASNTLGYKPDPLMAVLFSDYNINHLKDIIVSKIYSITSDSGLSGKKGEGVTIQINMDDLFNYLINKYQNNKVYNGSICFVCTKKDTKVQDELIKLNTDIIQDYVTKMISQLNMYFYYYKDASQLPEQLPIPQLSSSKGSRTLEYNTGFYSGNSNMASAFSQIGNII